MEKESEVEDLYTLRLTYDKLRADIEVSPIATVASLGQLAATQFQILEPNKVQLSRNGVIFKDGDLTIVQAGIENYNALDVKALARTEARSPSITSLNLIPREAFSQLSTKELIEYLLSKGVQLSEEVQRLFEQQAIDGEVLLVGETQQFLLNKGVPFGIVQKILNRIPQN